MNKIGKNKTLLIAIIGIIIVAGIIVIATSGFNFDLKYQKSQQIQLNLKKDFEISDIKQITDEIFGKEQVIIQPVEVYKDAVAITAKEITDEQKTNLIAKINEKYGTEFSAEETTINELTNTRGRDIIKPYIVPLIISTAIILLYVAMRYYKLGSIKCVLRTIAILILTQVILFSLIAITRVPIGTLTIPMVLAVYLLTLFGITNNFEKKLDEIKVD